MADLTDFTAAVRALAAEERKKAPDHPAAEELAAHASRSLPAARAEVLNEHLALCPECAALVLDYVQFEPSEPAHVEAAEETAAAWVEFQRRIGASQRGAGIAAAPRRTRRFASPGLLAAAAIVAALGLGLWGWSLHQELDAARAPRLDVAIHDLDPSGSDQVRGDRPPRSLDLSSGATVFLALPGVAGSAEVRVEIVDSRGRELWTLEGGRVDSMMANLSLHLPPGSLTTGRYEIRVYEDRSDGLLATYPVAVR